MPEPIPLKYYKNQYEGANQFYTGTNATSGSTEVTRDEYIAGLQNYVNQAQAFNQNYMTGAAYMATRPGERKTASSYYDASGREYVGPGYDSASMALVNQRLQEALNNPVQNSGYVMNNGVMTTQANVDLDAQNKAGVQAGTMQEISPGMYVPTGSAASRLESGTLTPQEQQTLASQGLTPQGTPIPATTATLPRQNLVQGALNPKGQEANTLYDFYAAQGTPLPSLQERGGLYERLGLGGGGEYRGTAAQNTALLNSLKQQAQFGNALTGDVDVAKTMAADLLGNKTGLVIPQIGTPTTLMDYGNALLQQLFNPQETQESRDNDLLTNRIAELTRASGNKQNDLLAEQERAGVQRLEAEKRDLETALRTEAQIFFQRQQNILNQQGVSRGAMVGQEREADADRVLKMGQMSVVLDAVNGSYMAAMNKAQGIVDAKYSQIESEIAYTQILLEANRDKMDRKEQKQAQALEVFLQFRSEALAEQKAEENAIYELAIEAQKNGASAATTQKIMSSTSRQQALGLAGTYIGKLDREQQAFENDVTLQKLAIDRQQANAAGAGGGKILSPTEAAMFGVPFGTTEGQALGLYAIAPANREQLAQFTNAKTIVDQIEDVALRLLTTEKFDRNYQKLGQEASLNWGAFTGKNLDAVELESKKGVLSSLVRSLGEKGALNEGDIQRAQKAIPGFGDSTASARQKIAALREIFSNAEKQLYAGYTTPVTGQPPQTPQTTGGGVEQFRSKYNY